MRSCSLFSGVLPSAPPPCMADQVCTSLHPQFEVRHPPAPTQGWRAGEVGGGKAATLPPLCHLHSWGHLERETQAHGQFVKDEQGEGRHGGFSQRPHNPPPRCRGFPQSPRCAEPWGKGGAASHLGVQDRAEFQSHCVITERLSGEREHTVQGPHLESIWAPRPSGERAGEAWPWLRALLLTVQWPGK